MNELQQTLARRQAIVCSAVLIGVACIGVAIHDRPDGATELKIPVAMLRSDAAQLALMLRERDELPRAFLSAHSKQLLESIDQTRTELGTLQLRERDLQSLRIAAQRTAADLTNVAGSLARNSSNISEMPKSLLERQRRLRAIEVSLER